MILQGQQLPRRVNVPLNAQLARIQTGTYHLIGTRRRKIAGTVFRASFNSVITIHSQLAVFS